MRTNSTFNLVTQPNDPTAPNAIIEHFGYVARFMAAAMQVEKEGQYVELRVDNQAPIILRPDGQVNYQVVFSNECTACSSPILDSRDETKRNDFHFARKILRLPIGRLRIGLKIDSQVDPGDPDFCPSLVARATDESPCMGGGYGGG